MNITRRLFIGAVLVALLAPASFSQPGPHSVVMHPMRAKMRDGVTLIADVYWPKADGTFPVLVQRTPYNRKGGHEMAQELASYGYVVVMQDTRGRFESEGEFYPFRYESQDGYDTVEWAAKLQQSNGRVGMFGGSYVGATQMLAAMAAPPHLEAIFPYVTSSEYYEGWTYAGGAWAQWFGSSWGSSLSIDTMMRKTRDALRPRDWVKELPPENYLLFRPPAAADAAPYLRDWIAHETDDDYWKPVKVGDHYAEMKVKALHAGGWHDLFSKGSILNYLGMREKAATPEARKGQRLLFGPWAHAATSPQGKIGDVTFGKQAVLDMTATTLRWFDYALKDKPNEFATGAPVRIFVLGENEWRDEQEFPLARAKQTRFYLHSAGKANTGAGDGALSTARPATEPADTFVYDPANPVPTIGGRLCCGDQLPPGPFDQRPNEARADVLVFSTPPMEKRTEVTGFITLDLYASTSAADTDWTALLVDVAPDGYARYLADGIVRARYRESTRKADPIEPGKIYRYTVDLWATSNAFLPGHRLRLYVSSSNFPRFNRNLNTGEPILGGTRMITAQQTIYHDAQHPSALVLPVVPR